MARLLVLTDPRELVRELAAATRHGNEGQFLVHEAIRKALPAHEQAEELWERATGEYRKALRDVAAHLDALTARPAASGEETVHLLWFWSGPSGWGTLVVEDGWSWERAERFLSRTAIAHALLTAGRLHAPGVRRHSGPAPDPVRDRRGADCPPPATS
ncbi:TetR/AcrR family transcriptional regulator [Streptomyces griseoincarnatus]